VAEGCPRDDEDQWRLSGTLPTLSQQGQVCTPSCCFIHHGAEAANSGVTCRQNGGVNIDPGVDIAAHLNIVAGAQLGK